MIIDLRLSVEAPDGTDAEHVASRLNRALDTSAPDLPWVVGAVLPSAETKQIALVRELAANYRDGLLRAGTAMDAIAWALL